MSGANAGVFDIAKGSVNSQQQQQSLPPNKRVSNFGSTGDTFLEEGAQTVFARQQEIDAQGNDWGNLEASNLQNNFFASLVNPNILNFGANERIRIWIWLRLTTFILPRVWALTDGNFSLMNHLERRSLRIMKYWQRNMKFKDLTCVSLHVASAIEHI